MIKRFYEFKEANWHCTACEFKGAIFQDWETHKCEDYGGKNERELTVDDFTPLPGPGEPQYRIYHWPSQDVDRVYRAPEMSFLAERQYGFVCFGLDPNASAIDPNKRRSRTFLETEDPVLENRASHPSQYAKRWMRDSLLRYDMHMRGLKGDPIIDERCAEGMVTLSGDMPLQVNGGLNTGAMIKAHGGKITN